MTTQRTRPTRARQVWEYVAYVWLWSRIGWAAIILVYAVAVILLRDPVVPAFRPAGG